MPFRSSKDAAEGDERDHSSSEEPDTHIDNPLFRPTETRRTATFGPAVSRHAPMEEPTDATVPRPEPTAPMIRRAARRRSWTPTLSALAIGALLGLALVAAYGSCR